MGHIVYTWATSKTTNNLDLFTSKPKVTFRNRKKGVQELYRKFDLAPADKSANIAVVV